MKLYLVKVEMYDYTEEGISLFDPDSKCNVYSDFEQARLAGLNDLSTRIKDIEESTNCSFSTMLKEEKVDYSFHIIQIDDLQYAEEFDVKYDEFKSEMYNNLEPTHKVYELDDTGKIIRIDYEYRYKNALWEAQNTIRLYPEDFEKEASEKFKIGDIVKLKHELEIGDGYIDDNLDRIYVVRWLPRKFHGEKYFENKYALVSLYKTDYNSCGNKELFTYEYWEKDIEAYTGKIEENSEYDLLSRLVKGDLETLGDYWHKIKIGEFPLTIETFKRETGDDTNNWGFFSTELSSSRTGLKMSIYPEKNICGENVRNCLPRIRIANTQNKYEDTFSVTLEENPRVIIGENKLAKEDYKEICEFIRRNLDILLKHFDPSDDFDDDELWKALFARGEIKEY